MFGRVLSFFLPSEDKANLVRLIEALQLISNYGITIQTNDVINRNTGVKYNTKLEMVAKLIAEGKSSPNTILTKLLGTYDADAQGLQEAIDDTQAVVSDARTRLLMLEGADNQAIYSPAAQALVAVERFATKTTQLKDGKNVVDRSKQVGGRVFTSAADALEELKKQIAKLPKPIQKLTP